MKQYKHNCNECIYLGKYSSLSSDYDVYFCHGTLLARYGNEPSEYLSMNIKEMLWPILKEQKGTLPNIFAEFIGCFNIELDK